MLSRIKQPARALVGAVAIASLAACAPLPQAKLLTATDWQARVKTKYDEFKKVTTYEGGEISRSYVDAMFLRAWRYDSKRDEVVYQIYVADYYNGEWRFYDEAWDSNGKRLDTTLIARKVGSCTSSGCNHFEHVGVNVTKAYLEQAQAEGVRFKLSGRSGEQVFFLPPAYIGAFLAATEK